MSSTRRLDITRSGVGGRSIPSPTVRHFTAGCATCFAASARGDQAPFATRATLTGRLIGSTSYCTLRPQHRGLEIGWTWLTPAAWRTGANAEAKLLMLRHAFERLGCQRVEFETDELNERLRHALEALPARFEGVLRDVKLVGERRRSSAIYAILDREWPGVRARLERRVQRRTHASGT